MYMYGKQIDEKYVVTSNRVKQLFEKNVELLSKKRNEYIHIITSLRY